MGGTRYADNDIPAERRWFRWPEDARSRGCKAAVTGTRARTLSRVTRGRTRADAVRLVDDNGQAEYRFVRWPVASTEQTQFAEKAANDMATDGWELDYSTYIPSGQVLFTIWKRYKWTPKKEGT
jgi:hypothetical protein